METLESSRMCRLCGQQSGISINIFDESENHVKKINAVLPIMVHEMDLLPKQMCHRCSYKLEEFHKFYVDCLKTDAALKSQLSWMRKDRDKEKIGVPMVHIENMKIKAESLDYDVYELEPLIENMEYINSMALPAGGIHNGLTYATLSRYRCCCDKKDQSRAKKTTAGFCQNYRESVFKCGEIANDSRKSLTLVNATPKLRPMKKNTFTQAEFPDCPQNHLLYVDAVENAQDRLTADTNTKDASSLNTRNCSYDKLETIPKNSAASRSTIVRNLRPRINLVNYASNKKTIVHNLRPRNTLVNYTSNKRKTSIDANSGPSIIASNSEISNSKTTFASNFKLTRQIKVEQIDEMEGRSLRPRRTVVDYQEPKMRKVSDHRTKRRKVEDAEQNTKPHSKNENASSNKFALKLKIKQEVLDDLEDTVLSEMTNAIPRLPNNSLANLPAKVEAVTSDNDVSSRNDMSDYFKSNHPQLRNKFQLAKQKSFSNIMKNRLTKTKKIYRLPAANYSPKCLRSQDTFLRNGKTRKKDYIEWPVKKLQTRKLMDIVNKNTKPAVVKLAETIKHYCETCNVSFANKELFKLHRCYYD